jgi:hypothetical protein
MVRSVGHRARQHRRGPAAPPPRFGAVALVALATSLAVVAGACGSTSVTTPPPSSGAAPSPTWNPRIAEIDSFVAVWEAQQPPAYAYTVTHEADGTGGGAWHATHIDGRTESLELRATQAGANASPYLVEGAFDRARELLSAGGTTTYDVDQQYGYLARLRYEQPSGASDQSFTDTVTDFTTPGDRTAAERARTSLDEALGRWNAYASPAWQYTWTRYAAADTPASATTYTVRHQDGRTVAVQADGTTDAAPPREATIEGTVATVMAVLAGGGWVDVSADAATGLNLLIAVDPSPSATGDGYWIRVAVADLAKQSAAKALASARDRWSTAGLKKYSYTWTYDGCAQYSARVIIRADALKAKGRSSAACEASPIRPSVTDLFAAIAGTLDSGGRVSATYDKKLGFPTKVVFGAGPDPARTITITGFKRG